jgi:KDO2-lipid IV(A) lauroyltransferase
MTIELGDFLKASVVIFLYGLLWLLPVKAASFIMGKLARFLGPKLRVTKIAKNNLTRTMPEITPDEQDKLIEDMWENLGRTVGEFPFVSRCSKEEFDSFVVVEGKEDLSRYLDQEIPALFFSAHMANWELAPKTAAMFGKPVGIVYRKSNNPFIDRLICYARQNYQSHSIAKGATGARQLLECLKNKQSVGMLIDQKMNEGIAVPFFGREAMTAPAIATLARKFKCPVIPTQIIREQGVRFRVVIHPALYAPCTQDSHEDVRQFMTQLNQIIEGWIRQHPAQWFWVHNRWPKETKS